MAYTDPVYGSGYRYYARPIGCAAGSDARMLTLGYIGTVPGSGYVALLGRHGRLNRGGTGYNTVAAAETRAGERGPAVENRPDDPARLRPKA